MTFLLDIFPGYLPPDKLRVGGKCHMPPEMGGEAVTLNNTSDYRAMELTD